MPDMCMCEGYDCPKKNQCYRHRANPDPYWQSWIAERPYKDGDKCSLFIDIGDRRNLRAIEDNIPG